MHLCDYCGEPFTPRRQGSPGRFCPGTDHRRRYWSEAGRKYAPAPKKRRRRPPQAHAAPALDSVQRMEAEAIAAGCKDMFARPRCQKAAGSPRRARRRGPPARLGCSAAADRSKSRNTEERCRRKTQTKSFESPPGDTIGHEGFV